MTGCFKRKKKVPLQAITAHEPIPGYRIRERLGAGGYGEVWKADAPGGLAKAIKFVYGHLNEDRASRELKALSRIKSVRHPFLLSLERIEVVEGQLLIVTELADQSLKERFDECREQGLPGIPRDELLRYLQDTADVLDYMNEEYCLQHLDIKPENLLLLAGRVKVADFGLVKDLHDATASIMGGLTPLYAPPEVFDGRPSHWSDQYSLAIVYQEMLTGELPFAGSTAMQLARQHMHSRPRITALPPSDQPIIAQALQKTPTQRFANCRELLQALAIPDTPSGAVTRNTPTPAGRTANHTEIGSASCRSPSPSPAHPAARLPRVDPAPVLTTTAPVEPVPNERATEPILYVGIGGTGARVVARLQQRLQHSLDTGPTQFAPSIVALDTDARELAAIARTKQNSTASPVDLIATPLRQPQSYRRKAPQLLSWISRRWLYNIPRSLKTDGLRPLGRLAFADHIETIRTHLTRALTAYADKSRETSPESAAAPPAHRRTQRVVLIASISGGTGSGMFIDTGFLVRQLLEDLNMSHITVQSVLLYSTGRTARWKELAAVNAYAALAELHHFASPGSSFPGDCSCGLRPRSGPATPFDDVQFVHCGADLDDHQYSAAINGLVDQLVLDTPRMAGPLFDACRLRSGAAPYDGTKLHTFGTCILRCLSHSLLTETIEHICRNVVERWISGTHVPPRNWSTESCRATASLATNETERPPTGGLAMTVDQWFVETRFDTQHLMEHIASEIDRRLQSRVDQFLESQLAKLLSDDNSADPQTPGVAIRRWNRLLDEVLGPRWNDDEVRVRHPGVLDNAIEAACQELAVEAAGSLRQRVLALVEDPTARLHGAAWTVQTCSNRCAAIRDELRRMEEDTEQQLQQIEAQLAELSVSSDHAERRHAPNLRSLLEPHGKMRMKLYVLAHSTTVLRTVKGRLAIVQDELQELVRRSRQLAESFEIRRADLPSTESGQSEDTIRQLGSSTNQFLVDNLAAMVELTEEMIQQADRATAPSLQRLMSDAGPAMNQLPNQLRDFGRTTVLETTKGLNAVGIMFGQQSDSATQTTVLRECLDTAAPLLANCGGAQRLLVMLPDSAANPRPLEILHDDLHELPSATMIPSSDFVICREITNIPMTQVAVQLIDCRTDYLDFANRLHTRHDICWSELPDLV